jgi:hypothetical protein
VELRLTQCSYDIRCRGGKGDTAFKGPTILNESISAASVKEDDLNNSHRGVANLDATFLIRQVTVRAHVLIWREILDARLKRTQPL